jgi:tRNA threonylcarbamoyladenosine modification (KEOPS) complex Cgi121 subunit
MDTERKFYKLGTTFVSIIGVKRIQAKDPGAVIDCLRRISDRVSVQAIDANIIYGIEHLLEVLKVTLEAKKRKIMIAKNPETDLLLRLCYTNQISFALKYGAMKNDTNCCFVILAKDKKELLKVNNNINKLFKVDNSVLTPNEEKRTMISRKIGLRNGPLLFEHNDDSSIFVRFISERSCLITP